MVWVLVGVAGYLLGAVPFAYLLTKAATGEDLRLTGSGNVGATNALRQTGWGLGLAVLALDVGKGVLAVLCGAWIGQHLGPLPPGALATFGPEAGLLPGIVAGLASILGHIFPCWLRFSGGKGVATAAGVMGVLAPVATLGGVVAFLTIVWRTRYVSLGSMTAAVLVPILAFVNGDGRLVQAAAVIVGAIVLIKHRDNFARLRGGRERRV